MATNKHGLAGWEHIEDWELPFNNPHAAQVYSNEQKQHYEIDPPFYRILHEDSPEKSYVKDKNFKKSVIHWGQRKLLLSEIEFLTQVGRAALEGATVVYAGAAPGSHMDYLSSLFPFVHFILVDPAPFTVRPSDRIEIIQDLFTDELAVDISSKHDNVFFISDIRTADPDTDSGDEVERKVASDMESQKRWHLLLNSKRSMLKFRLPWDSSSSVYLDGDIYLPVWGPQTTTECRLITSRENPKAMRVYDHEKYERQMFYFNRVTRTSLYRHGVSHGEGLDHCYDCRAEIEILYRYMVDFTPMSANSSDIFKKIAVMSKEISRAIPGRRTLLDQNPDREQRKQNIKRAQYDSKSGRPAHEVAGWTNSHLLLTDKLEVLHRRVSQLELLGPL